MYGGGVIGKKIAAILEEWSIFYLEDDDDEDH